MKAPRFKVGDIIERKHNGFQRRIVAVINDYLEADGQYGYVYETRFSDKDEWKYYFPSQCSEQHLRWWGNYGREESIY